MKPRNYLILYTLLFSQSSLAIDPTPSGVPGNTELIIKINKACIANPFSTTSWILPEKPTVEVGAFRSEFDLDKNSIKTNSLPIPGFKRIAFPKKGTKSKKLHYGASEYEFANYVIKIPMSEVDKVIVQIPRPKVNNKLVDFFDVASGDSNKQKPIQIAGFYVKINNVRSLIAFDGRGYTKVIDDLWNGNYEGKPHYESLWPRMATMLGSQRSAHAKASGQVGMYDAPPDCNVSTSFKYSAEYVERGTYENAPAPRKVNRGVNSLSTQK